MRKKIVIGNWKMNKSRAEALDTAREFRAAAAGEEVEFGICAPYIYLGDLVREILDLNIGAQDVFWKDSGAFTGFISAKMLKDLGVKYAIIGHSERRGRFGKLEVPETTLGSFAETDETVNLKLKACIAEGIVPIVCVGETLSEREAGNTDSVIAKQIEGALAGISETDLSTLVVAYEPVWAIGTGKVCDAAEANRVCGMIRGCLPVSIRDAVRIQYGGSVNPGNAQELFSQSDIDGGLVGGASLKAEDFAQVVKAAAN
jgi:triosephosphate isomerase